MPQNGYSIGRDVTLTIVLPDGSTLNMGKVTNFDAKPDVTDQKINGLDGLTDHLRFYQGWSGSFTLQRRTPDLDNYFAALEANYYAGADEPPATIQQTIEEPSGQVSQFRFERVLLKFDDAGAWAADKAVEQKVTFLATRRVQQA